MPAPVAFFVYNRLDHTQKTVEALQKNPLAKETDLIVFSDAARTPDKEGAVVAVRGYVASINGFKSLTVHHRPHNYGLANSIIDGVTQVLGEYERVIVMEDDLVTSPHFLAYMNEALERYANDERVASIHGYVYPVKQPLPEAFFLPGADCWGWATWRRGWLLFNLNGQYLLDELRRRKLMRAFDFEGAYSYSKMLQGQINGINDSWAVRWHASAFLAGKLTLYPGRSLVQNIGNEGSGTHCGTTSIYDVCVSDTPICLDGLLVEASEQALKAIIKHLRAHSFSSKFLSRNMSLSLKALAKDWVPPASLRILKKILHMEEGIRFEGEYFSWEEASAQCVGYDAENILPKVLAATLKVKNGEAAFERDSVLFDKIEYAWPVLSGLMWAASRNSGVLNVLDFGGALGSSYFQNRMFLNDLPEVRWNVVEQPHYVEAGQKHIQDKHLRFYPTIETCLEENQPNVVLLSSVLQYLPDTLALINDICALGCGIIILDRTIVNSTKYDRIYVQHVPSSIYLASYPCRSLSEKHLINSISKNYILKTSFDSLCFPALFLIKSEFKGYIFHKEYL
jgi:putative methyltransferase (TIGR04325 family)